MIEIGNIVTLENGVEYLLLEELNDGGRRFVYSVRVEKDETPTTDYVIFEAVVDADGEYLKTVDDKAEYDALIEKFKNIINGKVISGDYDDMVTSLDEDAE
ncbi:MAG TPA: DUF1292 domain-containing protein [Bacilli bacterium]|jgi:hypothetical protein|nr:DUF1292 domain-containing protein [Bacilli bacterium]HPZ23646.1 DUF1292 domain-containing protein [Bacilli bacterium]HQC83875.1 DUF1292 domain-containing protein [Bacilli bacterium]